MGKTAVALATALGMAAAVVEGFVLAPCSISYSTRGSPVHGAAGLSQPTCAMLRRSSHRIPLKMVLSEEDMLFYPGTWSLNQEIEGAKSTYFVTLNPDSTVTLPPEIGTDNTDSKIRWAVKRKDFILAVPKRSTLSTIFDDREYFGTPAREEGTIKGTIMDGESDPEFVGRFSMSKIAAYTSDADSSSSLEWDGKEDEEVWFDD